jgi:hypothetical protein
MEFHYCGTHHSSGKCVSHNAELWLKASMWVPSYMELSAQVGIYFKIVIQVIHTALRNVV